MDLVEVLPGERYLDLGCGEGRVMQAIARRGGVSLGVDVAEPLLARAAAHGEVFRAEVPPLDFLPDASVDGVVVVLVLEHLADEAAVFAEARRVTGDGGSLVVVMNHPVWTAPDSTPIDYGDGEILWRPGAYFSRGSSREPAGDGQVEFFHRTMADLLTGAARAGWSLRRMVEEGVSPDQVERIPGLAGQDHIPRLLGVRWVAV